MMQMILLLQICVDVMTLCMNIVSFSYSRLNLLVDKNDYTKQNCVYEENYLLKNSSSSVFIVPSDA